MATPMRRKLAREIGRDHELAQELWKTGLPNARVIAAAIAIPALVTERQMEKWVKDFDSWGICDCCCSYLFDKTRFPWQKAVEWSSRTSEFEKRAAFVLMAVLAIHDKRAPDAEFLRFLPVIERESDDDRHFVKKAVNWALRQIGKRNAKLNLAATRAARRIQKRKSKSARWIGSDSLRELEGDAVRKRLALRG